MTEERKKASKGQRKHIRRKKAVMRKRREAPDMRMALLSFPQKRVLDCIIDGIRKHQRPPTLREIGVATQTHFTSVRDVVNTLQKKGFITINADASRGIRLNREVFEVKVQAVS